MLIRRVMVLPAIALAVALLGAPNASAIQFGSGDFTGNVDITLSYGLTFRAADRDTAIIGRQNGGAAHSINGDNGNLNYNNGDITSNRGKASFEIDLGYGGFGFFSRFFTFYDYEIVDGDTRRTALSQEAIDRVGRDLRLLDAYASYFGSLGSGFIDVRAGNMVLNWGESAFIQGGLNSINPVDVGLLRGAGSEVKDALTAVPRIDVAVGAGSRFSAEGYYDITYEETIIDPVGTFFSVTDLAGPGGEHVFLNFGEPFPGGPTDDPPLLGANAAVVRGDDRLAKDGGQFGVALRYFEPNLGDTEFGFYYQHTHSRLPLISGMTGTLAGAAGGDYAGSARYFLEYPEDIDVLGFSLATYVPWTSTALSGEVTYKIDQPLQVDDVELLFAALSPLGQLTDSAKIFWLNQLGVFGFEEEIPGYRRKDVLQAQVTFTQLFGPGLGADQSVILLETGFNHVSDMESQDVLRYDAGGTYTSGTEAFTQVGVQPETESPDGFADDFSWGYRALARMEFNSAIASVNLIPKVAWLHDVSGNTPAPILNFREGRKTITFGLAAQYLLAWQLDLTYSNSFGGGRYNLRADRDFFSASLSYAF